MLDSFLVQNFRLFDDLQIEKLRQVNLFVGRNNSGKTSILEALQIYAADANLDVLLEVISSHEGNWEAEIAPETEVAQPTAVALRSLLCGFQPMIPGLSGIVLGPAGDQGQRITIKSEPYQIVQDEGGTKWVRVSSPDNLDLANLKLWLVVGDATRTRRLAPLEGFDELQRKRPNGSVPGGERKYRYPFSAVPAQGLTDREIGSLWDKVSITDLQSDVLAGLQLIDSRISAIAFVGERRRVPVVRLSVSSERYALKSMGDGLMRVLQMTLALVNAKDGILLIDEFENGLHWAVQPRLWQLVFRLSKRLNVQVFATTHSQDCVKAFCSVWQDDERTATFHRLDRDSQKGVKVTAYNRSTLSDSVETEVEVR